jgi:DNA repair exonuclease SbcCD ATPase subunit|nr:MAG TPA: chromosome partition protein [Caudoviricetes sp.]
MILKSLHMENFKGIKRLDVNFSNKTSIKGQNAAGKTTIFDAFTWLLFNKNSAGEEKFNVRPLDKDGKRIDNVEIKVVAVLDVDGKEVELSKVQKQNWVKKRGTDTVTLQGNINSFEIDGYPKSEAEFKAYISGLAQSEEMFKMLTNPQYFSSLKWKDQRDILMKLVAEVSDVELAKEDAKYAPLLDELEKAPSTDDIRSKFSKALSEWKKKQAEIPVRIDEAKKSKVDVDVAEQELLKADLERKIEALEDLIGKSDVRIDEMRSEEMHCQFEMSAIAQTMDNELSSKRHKIENHKYDHERKLEDVRSSIRKTQDSIERNKKSISEQTLKKSDLVKRYKEEKEKKFDDSKWIFDVSTAVCSLCGQRLPEDKIESLRADFSQRKADAIEIFNEEHAKTLAMIVDDGNACAEMIKKLTENNKELENTIDTLKLHEAEEIDIIKGFDEQISKVPSCAAYFMQNVEYAKLKAKRDELRADIAELESKGTDKVADYAKADIAKLKSQLDEVNKIIAQAANNVMIDDRIETLRDEQKEIGQKVADQEQMLYLLEEFIRFKLNKVSESINSHFKTVNFKLFEMQLNGGMKDCCECTVNGVPYSTLNSGHRIVAGLDIIRSLSELYGVSVPIFVDNAESLNEFNVPDMDTQLILLSVSEDKQLKVEGV